eukprot:CAMPEP_0113543468 /NCGR_PEP_ID=MMETSP0015_2-20120614/10174_1 /TAXON_ID=2838 /ORGANISM="Odontella" /LENGTH=1074 /DNA_ID=CAMNT_0000443629 /DNA_START=285 /DNA_END=3508 /DNA_ORIENTATION=- /assembly_acc=CAM_ASM_000160
MMGGGMGDAYGASTGSYAARSAQAHASAGGPVQPGSYSGGGGVPSQPQPQPAAPAPVGGGRQPHYHHATHQDSPAMMAEQQRLLAESTRRVQENVYYMKQAMDNDDLPTVLDRASSMLAELGDPHHHHQHGHGHSHQTGGGHGNHRPGVQLSPKNYYELHMRCMDELPNLEEYLLGVTGADESQAATQQQQHPAMMRQQYQPPRQTMKELYEAVQYAPRVVPRLYLQICAGSALLRSGEAGAKEILSELIEAVKCVQCPIRGLFLRHYLLQATRDKLPDAPDTDDEGQENEQEAENAGTVKDAYTFVLSNFIEMNKLWVRIQHVPGERSNKEARKRRERERNELRLLVGTNLVRLSQLDGVTTEVYGIVILPRILDQIAACRDPLAQAYLMDCIIQVFPDNFHIRTLDTFLGVCPKLREKVNIRTIVQSMMERLANYYVDASLLEDEAQAQEREQGVESVHSIAASVDSFKMFDDCIQRIFEARGKAMPPKEVIRLETALLNFSLRCYPGRMDHISRCLGVCAASLRGGGDGDGSVEGDVEGRVIPPRRKLDDAAVDELEKLLSIPLDSLALKVLELEHYSDLLTFLPWDNRRQVAVVMLKAVETSGQPLTDIGQIEELFSIITPLIHDEGAEGSGVSSDVASLGGGDGGVNRTADLMGALGVSKQSSTLSSAGGTSFSENDPASNPAAAAAFLEEQVLVAKLVHLLDHDDTDVLFEMLGVAYRHLRGGGKRRAAHTLPPVAFSALRLLDRVRGAEFPPRSGGDAIGVPTEVDVPRAEDEGVVDKEEGGDAEGESPPAPDSSAEDEARGERDALPPPPFAKAINCRKVYVFAQKTVAALSPGNPEIGLKLYLNIANSADRCATAARESGAAEWSEFSSVAYELMAQAFLLYEDEVSDSKAQQRAITSMVGTLLACRTFEQQDFEALVTKTAQYAAKLLKKADQCKMVTLCSHLFFNGDEDDQSALRSHPQRVLECLQRALKIADACSMASPSNVQLFVDILDYYVYYFERKNPVITDKFVSGLVALINEHMGNMGLDNSAAVAEARAHFQQIVRYIKQKKIDSDTAERFAPIIC